MEGLDWMTTGEVRDARIAQGACFDAVCQTIAALEVKGDLVGDQFAAQRQALIEAATAVDTARSELDAGRGNTWTYANCVGLLSKQLEALVKGTSKVGDDVDATLAAILGSGPT
jgi:hypothetical protein